MRVLRRVAALGLASLLTFTAIAVADTAAAEVAPETVIKINEVRSSSGATSVPGDSGEDFVELINTGDAAVDLNGWTFQDNDLLQAPLVFTSVETIVGPGERFVFWPDDDLAYGTRRPGPRQG